MKKQLSTQELREKYNDLLSNKAIKHIVNQTENNTDNPTNEEKYLATARKNIAILMPRLKAVLSE